MTQPDRLVEEDGNPCAGIDGAASESRRVARTRRKEQRRAGLYAAQVHRDSLTGMVERRALDLLLNNHRQVFDRRGRTSVVMLDLDNFKKVNDSFGEFAGDKVLCSAAELVRACAAPRDIVYRYREDGFLIIRPSTCYADGLYWSEELRRRIAKQSVALDSGCVAVRASIGFVNCPSHEVTSATVEEAEEALFLAKARGRNRTCTNEMVAFCRQADRIRCGLATTVEERLAELLQREGPRLGPTQRTHLTTHAEYVSNLAVRLATTLGMHAGDVARVRVAGLCHDLGKYVIPEEVLAKPGRLSEAEWSVVARHAADGAEMAFMLGTDQRTADSIRHHHARFDRAVASREHRNEGVPLGARILSVSDALVTMTSYRPYQAIRSFTGAVRELQRESGRQFDPEVVGALPHALLAAGRRENRPGSASGAHPDYV